MVSCVCVPSARKTRLKEKLDERKKQRPKTAVATSQHSLALPVEGAQYLWSVAQVLLEVVPEETAIRPPFWEAALVAGAAF